MTRLLLVGWDAADWKVIDKLVTKHEMPNLAHLLAAGVRGNLATIHPPLSPMVWTSIATGKRPPKHGIHGFTEPTEDGLAVRPVSNLGRSTKAVWNILNQHGKRSLVVGWWPSHPAEPIDGVMVSNHFPFETQTDPKTPLPRGTVWPAKWETPLAALRVHGIEIDGEMLRLFVPHWQQVDQDKDKSLHDLAGIVAETMSIHAAATELMAQERWDLAAVYFTGIDHFSHRFMRYHAGKVPRREGETDPALYRDIVANGYRFHDAMLGRLVELAGPDCAVLICSDHGFHSDKLLPDTIPAEAAGPAVEHRDFGVVCFKGPGVRAGERIYGASVLDIAPTVLHMFGLPAGADMDGKVLINAFADRALPPPVASWDAVAGADGRHPPDRHYDGVASFESLQQLVALGYVAPPGGAAGDAVKACVVENRYNLARAEMDAGRHDRAETILAELIAGDGEQVRFHQHLFECLLRQRKLDEAKRRLDAFDAASADLAERSAAELARRRAERPDKSLANQREPKNRIELFDRRQLSEKLGGFAAERTLMRCRLLLAEPEGRAAAKPLLDELARQPALRRVLALFLAEGYALAGDDAAALGHIRRARRADPEDWRALTLAAQIHEAAGRDKAAVDHTVQSLALVYFQPLLHFRMGRALRRLGETARAEQAFKIALAQAPGLAIAHDALAALFERDPARIGEAALHRAHAEALRARRSAAAEAEPAAAPAVGGLAAFERNAPEAPPDRARLVAIVTGLPRSGTSMMMQMLKAGGVDAYTDGNRAADSDNPRGYYEHERATRLKEDAGWIAEARGKAVKIVAHLVPYLPAGESYRIVFMHRDLGEVVASQRAMLARLGRAGARLDEAALQRSYTGQLVRVQNWLERHPAIAVLAVNYADALADPQGTAARLARFLGAPFDADAAAAAVDAALRRQQQAASPAVA